MLTKQKVSSRLFPLSQAQKSELLKCYSLEHFINILETFFPYTRTNQAFLVKNIGMQDCINCQQKEHPYYKKFLQSIIFYFAF
jgi:hypothetical protein